MECSLFSEFKIDKICFYAEIITEKREIRWHLARIRENFENQNFDFIKIEILYPEKRSEQVSREISHFWRLTLRHALVITLFRLKYSKDYYLKQR